MSPKKQPMPDIDPDSSSFTPESFEKELQGLASKVKEETWFTTLKDQIPVYSRAAALLSLAAVYANVSQLTLSPVYGSIPSSVWHSKLIMAACFVGWSTNIYLGRLLPFRPAHLLPVIASYFPVIQYYLFRQSATFTAYWGPLVTEGLTLFPLMVLSAACTATCLDRADLTRLPRWLADSLPGLGSYGFYKLVESTSQTALRQFIGRTFFQTRLGLQLMLGASYMLFSVSPFMLLAIPATLHTVTSNTHVPSPVAFMWLNQTINPHGWMILDRKESVTGYISVVESLAQGFRVMRCDHSLLGGEWTSFKGGRVAEPIFGVFAMLEAVRLVQVAEPVPDAEATALVIGLGIGTAPAALVAHGVDTTVVEIDPAVHEFASRYFQLPSNHTSVIADAVDYAADLAVNSNQRFDYIVHDVFTGGAEPIPLFTLEFLQDLKTLLKPNGAIALNYAGDFSLPSPKIVLQTIFEVFRSCRIFREHPRGETEKDGRDFTNMVIFCTKSGGEVDFRTATAADMLDSPSRKAFLQPDHEVFLSELLVGEDYGVLRRNELEKLEQWQVQSALGHWELMRTVLPKIVWENW